MPAEILLQCIQRVEGGPSLENVAASNPRPELGLAGSEEAFRSAAPRLPTLGPGPGSLEEWNGSNALTRVLHASRFQPECSRHTGVRGTPPRPLPASFTSSGAILGAWIKRQTLFFLPVLWTREKKTSVHKIGRCSVEISLAILEPQHSDTFCLLLLLPRTGQTLPFPPFTEISYLY